jgi:hypothetical protein
MAEQSKSELTNKSQSSDIGWGIAAPVFAVVGTVIGAVVGLGGFDHLKDIFHHTPEVSQSTIDDISAAKRAVSGGDRIVEGLQNNWDKIGDFAQEKLREATGMVKGAGNGWAGIRDHLLGTATTDETRKLVGEAIQQLNQNDINSNEAIKNFVNGKDNFAKFGNDFLAKDSLGNVFIIDDDKFKQIDPQKFGGVLDLFTNPNKGFSAGELAKGQAALTPPQINWGDVGVKAAVGTAVGLTTAVALKSSFEGQSKSSPQSYADYQASSQFPDSQIKPSTANYLGLATNAKQLNRAMS